MPLLGEVILLQYATYKHCQVEIFSVALSKMLIFWKLGGIVTWIWTHWYVIYLIQISGDMRPHTWIV